MRTTSPRTTMNIGRSGNMCPFTVHHRPGRPSTNPGRRPMAYWKVRVGVAGSNPSGAGVP